MSWLPSINVRPEIGQQLVDGRERIAFLMVADVPMVALAGLVVVAQHAAAPLDIGQPIFEAVLRSRLWLRQAPDHDLDGGLLVEPLDLVHQQLGLHVGMDYNTEAVLLSIRPTPAGHLQGEVVFEMAVHPVGRQHEVRQSAGIGRARVAQGIVLVGHHGTLGDAADAADKPVRHKVRCHR